MRVVRSGIWACLVFEAIAGLAGCGTPGAPLPPSLNLPDRVTDLSGVRAGGQVTLTWTMPKKNTDRLLIKGAITVRVCRQQGGAKCERAGADLEFAPGADASFTETLPASLASGAPRPLSYFVELRNRSGRSAGLSNAALVLAGAPPEPVADLRTDLRKQGVELEWQPLRDETTVRLRRTVLTPKHEEPTSEGKEQAGLLKPEPEAVEENFLVEPGPHPGRAVDSTVRTGETYEYRAQRVERLTVKGEKLELDGALSAPVRVEVLDIFPPEVPTGLAAVATPAGTEPNGAATPASIDLSWQPVSDADTAGYIVYRREDGGEWRHVSPAQPVVGPAFHDAQVTPGHTYSYAVSAIDQRGHESARSAEAQETVPKP